MKKEQIAAQLYTLRDFAKTPAELAETLKKVKKIGYSAVQVSGVGPIDVKELAKMISGEGLICCATHESGAMILDEPEKVVEKLSVLNCKYTAYPWPHTNPITENDYKELAHRLDKSGAVLAKAGMTLCYHNHAIEFARFGNRTGLEILYGETDSRNLQGEPDTFWIQTGGECPVDWMRRLNNRLPLLHMKDYGISGNERLMFEVGYGNLNWKRIIPEAEKSGCEWFIVEEDVCRFDPFESIKMSYDYIVKEFC